MRGTGGVRYISVLGFGVSDHYDFGLGLEP